MNSSPLVTVVTPFYNTSEFLADCIESVLCQSYQNWEYVLVNNCSTDGSADIVNKYIVRYPGKMRLVHTTAFLSQVQNYNFALSLVSRESKYCKVVQADDWIFPECLQRMVDIGEAHPNVGIIAAYELERNIVSLDGLPYPSPETQGREVCRLFFTQNMSLFGSPTSLMIRSEIIRSRQPFYEERHAPFEDAHVCFDILEGWNYGFVHQVLTYSRRDNDSFLLRMRPYRFWLFSRLAKIVAHGRKYLSDDEYRYFLKDAERRYFSYLGKSALQGKDAEFWAFHRERLASIDYSLDRMFMAKWISMQKRTWLLQTAVYSVAATDSHTFVLDCHNNRG